MKTINKKNISLLITKKLNNNISYKNISDVISIFFEELFKELKTGKKIKIKNFCSFKLEKTKPRRYFNYWTKQFAISKGRPQFKIQLSYSLRKKISKHLDLFTP